MKSSTLAVVAMLLVTGLPSVRTWTDSTGKHEVRAEFVDFKDGIVRLRRDDGMTTSVPLERLSEADQEFVRSQMEPHGGAAAENTDVADLREKGERGAAPAGGGAIPARVLQHLKAATVFVKVTVGPLTSSGSGFLLKKERRVAYVVTNAHVVALVDHPSDLIDCVFDSGTKAEHSAVATVVTLDEDRDLAILKAELDTLPEPVDLDAKVAVVETLPVFILGFPFGDLLRTSDRHPAVTVSLGSISSIRRDDYDRVAVFQIDGNINPGNSGGPIVDAQGRLIGIAVAKVAGTQIGMAIPAEELSEMLNGRVAGARIEARRIENGIADMGAEVLLIDPMRKIRSVSIHYVPDTAVKERPKPDQNGAWPRLPDARKVPLTLDGQRAVGEFAIRSGDAAGAVYAFQIAYVGGDGVLAYTEPGRFTADSVPPGLAAGFPGKREEPIVRPSPWAKPDGGNARKPVVEFSWRPPPIHHIAPPSETAVAGRIERDSSDQCYTAVTAEGVSLDLGKSVLQVFACPTGKVVYVIRRGEPVVSMVDPLTWEVVGEIPVPESPTSIWADATLIGVACDASRVVVLIDAQKRSPIVSGTLPQLRGYTPDTIIGRAPDGAVMSLWQQDGGPWGERALIHVATNGKSQIMINGEPIYWATWLPEGTGVVAQGNFTFGPSGTFDLAFPQGPRQVRELHNNRLFGVAASFHTDTGPAFLTSDFKALAVLRTRVTPEDLYNSSGYRPNEPVDERRARGPRVPWTYLISPSFDRIFHEFPGHAMAELTEQQLFISVGTIGGIQPVCYYVSSRDGRVVREITLEWPKPNQQRPADCQFRYPWGAHTRPVFVPGHELLLMPSSNSSPSNTQITYTAFRCGPVNNGDVQLRTSDVSRNNPPLTVAAGEEFRYTPVPEPGVTASEFQLKRALPGMTIDPGTGALTWRPGREHIGRWPITILATVEGEVVTAITWTLEVR